MNQTLQNLIAIRKENKVSQEELADIIGVSQNVISRLEKGKRKIDLHMLEFYAGFFKLSISEILNYHLKDIDSLVNESSELYRTNSSQSIQLLKRHNAQLESRIDDLKYTIELQKETIEDYKLKLRSKQKGK